MLATINGYTVIQSREIVATGDGLHRQTSVILVDRGEQYPRYVTALHCEDDDQWSCGHYIDSLSQAVRDYEKR